MTINRVVLVGRLTKDPELRYTPSGVPVARFTIAVNRPFSSTDGERQADFIGCIAWRKQAENLANFMKKGNLIGVEGRIQTGSFEGQDGKRIYTTDVVADSIQFLEPRGNGSNSDDTQQYQSQPQYTGAGTGASNNPYGNQNNSFGHSQQNYTRVDEDPFANSKGPIEVSEDDLPF